MKSEQNIAGEQAGRLAQLREDGMAAFIGTDNEKQVFAERLSEEEIMHLIRGALDDVNPDDLDTISYAQFALSLAGRKNFEPIDAPNHGAEEMNAILGSVHARLATGVGLPREAELAAELAKLQLKT